MIDVQKVTDTVYVVGRTCVTIWRDSDNAIRTNPPLINEHLLALRNHIQFNNKVSSTNMVNKLG